MLSIVKVNLFYQNYSSQGKDNTQTSLTSILQNQQDINWTAIFMSQLVLPLFSHKIRLCNIDYITVAIESLIVRPINAWCYFEAAELIAWVYGPIFPNSRSDFSFNLVSIAIL